MVRALNGEQRVQKVCITTLHFQGNTLSQKLELWTPPAEKNYIMCSVACIHSAQLLKKLEDKEQREPKGWDQTDPLRELRVCPKQSRNLTQRRGRSYEKRRKQSIQKQGGGVLAGKNQAQQWMDGKSCNLPLPVSSAHIISGCSEWASSNVEFPFLSIKRIQCMVLLLQAGVQEHNTKLPEHDHLVPPSCLAVLDIEVTVLRSPSVTYVLRGRCKCREGRQGTASSCCPSSCPQGCGRAVCRHAYSIHKQPEPTKQDGHFYSLKSFLKFTGFCRRTTNLWKSCHECFCYRGYLRILESNLKCWAFLSQSLFSVLIVSMLRKMSLASRNSRIYLLEKALPRAT